MAAAYHSAGEETVRTTIDKAGRIVIPLELRDRLALKPGTELELSVGDDLSLRIVRHVPPPELVRVDGRLVVRPTVADDERPELDAAQLLDEERDRWPV